MNKEDAAAMLSAARKAMESGKTPALNRVEFVEGIAVFIGEGGMVLGWMNGADFDAMVSSMSKEQAP